MRKYKDVITNLENDILALYASNYTPSDIANELGTPEYVINATLTHFTENTDKSHNDIVRLFTVDKKPIIAISRETGITVKEILDILKLNSKLNLVNRDTTTSDFDENQTEKLKPIPSIAHHKNEKLPKIVSTLEDTTVTRILSAYKNGCEVHHICSRHKVNHAQLYALLDYYNIPRRRVIASYSQRGDQRDELTEKELIVLLVNQVDRDSIIENYKVTPLEITAIANKHKIKEIDTEPEQLDISVLLKAKKTVNLIAESYAIHPSIVRFILRYHKLEVKHIDA